MLTTRAVSYVKTLYAFTNSKICLRNFTTSDTEMWCINKSCARTWALLNPCRNGSGKSSIIPLMEWFYNPTLGEAHLDGKNIKNLRLS
ncbi:putative Type 1 protein exporter [Helianthus annuus]|nr:putative Type 1 protein exporter [Helianthus annuus]